MVQDYLPVFQLTHLQHIIDQGQQMICRNFHFLMVGPDQLFIVEMYLINIQQPNNSIDGSTDIMAHPA